MFQHFSLSFLEWSASKTSNQSKYFPPGYREYQGYKKIPPNPKRWNSKKIQSFNRPSYPDTKQAISRPESYFSREQPKSNGHSDSHHETAWRHEPIADQPTAENSTNKVNHPKIHRQTKSFRGNIYKPLLWGQAATGFQNRMPQIFYTTVQRLCLLSFH
jgi:hypothetical protein